MKSATAKSVSTAKTSSAKAKPAPSRKEAAAPASVSRAAAAEKPSVPVKSAATATPDRAARPAGAAEAVAKAPAPKVSTRVPAQSSGRSALRAPSMSTQSEVVTRTPPPMPMPYVPPVPAPVKKDARLANNWKTKPIEELTDAEVIAMPDSEYMNDKQMAFFRMKLVELKNEILANAGETTEHLREDTVVVPDPADRATIEEEHALELRTRDRERKLLKKIQQSIGRIDSGDYGYCDETGEPIGVPRLLARPTATLSLEAQQRRELKQKMFGD